MQGAVSKAEFARIVGVTRGRVSQWIAAGQIDGDALVIEGRSERIAVEAARRELGDRLGVDQRAPMSKARLDGVGVVADRGGHQDRSFARAQPWQREADRGGDGPAAMSRRTPRDRKWARLPDASLRPLTAPFPEFAAAVAASSSLPQRDALHVLRTAWRTVRERGAEGEAAAMAPMVEAAE